MDTKKIYKVVYTKFGLLGDSTYEDYFLSKESAIQYGIELTAKKLRKEASQIVNKCTLEKASYGEYIAVDGQGYGVYIYTIEARQ